jgi:SpoVK/Ycf46/Vps4 family AAA+-type ATPase
MTYFFKNGNRYNVSSDSSDISKELPAGNYVVKFNIMSGYYLEIGEEFTLPPKLYGNCVRYTDRILSTFRMRNKNTGVLLVGEKGSGKTLLMRNISIESGMPVFIINEPFVGDDFFSFLTSITQASIVLFDEFEKVYKEKQESILTLFDGTYQSNKLFIISSNDKWRLDDNMQNRPGRIYYMIEYSGVDEEFVREYCQDKLNNQEKTEDVVNVYKMFEAFNFDMLSSVVEELNRYDESPQELIKILNIRPEYGATCKYIPFIKLGEHNITSKMIDGFTGALNPYRHDVALSFNVCWNDKQDDNILDEIIGATDDDDLSKIKKLLDRQVIFLGSSNEDISEEDTEYSYVSVGATPEDILVHQGNTITYELDSDCILSLMSKSTSRR